MLKKNEACKSFLKKQAGLREKWWKALQITKTEALRIYDLMEWCDTCSLLLCQWRLPPENRKLEISRGPDKKKYYLVQTNDETITVEPWPFEDKSFDVRFEYRIVKQLKFVLSADFRQAFLKAPVEEEVWNVSRQNVHEKTNKV